MADTFAEAFLLAVFGEPSAHDVSDDPAGLKSSRHLVVGGEALQGGPQHVARFGQGENTLAEPHGTSNI